MYQMQIGTRRARSSRTGQSPAKMRDAASVISTIVAILGASAVGGYVGSKISDWLGWLFDRETSLYEQSARLKIEIDDLQQAIAAKQGELTQVEEELANVTRARYVAEENEHIDEEDGDFY